MSEGTISFSRVDLYNIKKALEAAIKASCDEMEKNGFTYVANKIDKALAVFQANDDLTDEIGESFTNWDCNEGWKD